jgi:hypothetical protein
MPCAAGARGDGGGGMWFGRSEIGTGTGGTGCRGEGNAVARESLRVKALR